MMLLYYLLFHSNFSIDFFPSNYADNLICYGKFKNTYYYYCYYHHHFIGFFHRIFFLQIIVDNMIWNRKMVMEKSF